MSNIGGVESNTGQVPIVGLQSILFDDVKEFMGAMIDGRNPDLTEEDLLRVKGFGAFLQQASDITLAYREEIVEARERFTARVLVTAEAVGGTAILASGTEGADDSSHDEHLIRTNNALQKDGDLTKPVAQSPTADSDAVVSRESARAEDTDRTENGTTGDLSAGSVKDAKSAVGGKAEDWDIVESMLVDIIRGKEVGTELRQSDFLSHPYFTAMIDEASGNKNKAKSQALQAARALAEKGVLRHNGKQKGASRWIVETDFLAK